MDFRYTTQLRASTTVLYQELVYNLTYNQSDEGFQPVNSLSPSSTFDFRNHRKFQSQTKCKTYQHHVNNNDIVPKHAVNNSWSNVD